MKNENHNAKGNEMAATYAIRYWTQNEFGDFVSYHSVSGGSDIEAAREIADSYRAAGYRVKIDTVYTI